MAITDKSLASQVEEISLKDIDESVVNWFKNDYPVAINGKAVPVIYATAERWAKVQKEKGFRDEKGALMLPLISIRRTVPTARKERYAAQGDETNFTIVKRLSENPTDNNRQPAEQTIREHDELYVRTKDLPIYEVLQIPYPSFVNVDYDVVVWTSYLSHQNILDENIFKNFKGGRQWMYVDDYFFFTTLDSTTDNSNLDDFSDKERIIKYTFKLTVHAYFIDKKEIISFRTSGNLKLRFSETSIPVKKL